MKNDKDMYMRMGIVHFMAYPEVMAGDGRTSRGFFCCPVALLLPKGRHRADWH